MDKGQVAFESVHKIASKYSVLLKAVELYTKTTKEIGALGEKVAAEYLKRHGLRVRDVNYARKTGEIDIIAEGPEEGGTLHFVEVKTIAVEEFPVGDPTNDTYDPSVNLHAAKVKKVARTGEWYVLEKRWEGEWQVDGALVWLRRRDGVARVQYLPQIV